MKKTLSVILSLVMVFVSVATLFVSTASAEAIPVGTNVIGYYHSESPYDTSTFEDTGFEDGALMKNGTDLTTNYGSWTALSSTGAIGNSGFDNYQPKLSEGALLIPAFWNPFTRAIKGMKANTEYTVSFKYKAATQEGVSKNIYTAFQNTSVFTQAKVAAGRSFELTSEWQTASFNIVNTYNDANGYAYIGFGNHTSASAGVPVVIDDLSIVEFDDYVYNENNVIGKYATESFFDSANFNYTAEQLNQMVKNDNSQPILLGTPDDLKTQYGTWSLTVASGAALRGDLKQYMPIAKNDALYFPIIPSAIAVRAIKGMKAGAEYTVSFKYKADTAVNKPILVGFANTYTALRPMDGSADGECDDYTSNSVTTQWQTASFNIVNTYNDANGYAYIGFGLSTSSALKFYIDNLSIVEVPAATANVTATSSNTKYGTVTGSGEYKKGDEVTLTATPVDAEYGVFVGWYDGENKVSDSATYTFTAEEDVALVAKFDTKNLIGKYDSVYDSSDFDGLDIAKGVYSEAYPIMFAPINAADIDEENNVKELPDGGVISQDLLPNTVAAAKDTTSNTYGSWFASGNNKSFVYNTANAPLYSSDSVLFRGARYYSRAIAGMENGKHYRISFKYRQHSAIGTVSAGLVSGKALHNLAAPVGAQFETTASYQTATFDVYNRYTDDAGMTYFSLHGTSDFWIDNLTIIEIEKDIVINSEDGKEEVAITLNGVGVEKQGMRLYNKIDKAWADNEAKEYGSIAIRKGYLDTVIKNVDKDGAFDLDLYKKFVDYVNNKGGSPQGFGKGIAYTVGGTAKLWTDKCDENTNAYTSYLTGIAPKYFADTYLVRSYAIDKAGNVHYGEIREISIYDMVYTIRTQYSDDTEGMAAANAFIEQAITAGATTYSQWLENKGLTDDTYTAN